jgi:hypothetical protein
LIIFDNFWLFFGPVKEFPSLAFSQIFFTLRVHGQEIGATGV